MKRFSIVAFSVLILPLLAICALAQGVPLQGGPWTPGHVPQYAGQGSQQPFIMDGGGAGGGGVGANISELGIVARGAGAPPYAGQGSGPFGTNACDYDAPLSNPTGYHFFCLSANAQGAALLAVGAVGAATPLPLSIIVNGINYPFPSSIVITNPTVASNAALSAISTATVQQVTRVGFTVSGDSPPVIYTASNSPCTLDAGAGDGGSQVPSINGKCWIWSASAPADIRIWGGDPSGTNDSAPALTRAIAAQSSLVGCEVAFTAGTYKFNGGVTAANTCHVYGFGRDTTLNVNFATGDFLTFAGQRSEVDHLLFTNSVPRTSGAYVHCGGIRCFPHDLYLSGPYIGVWLDPSTTLSVADKVECRNPTPQSVAAGGTCILVGATGGGTNPNTTSLLNITCARDSSGPSTSCLEVKSADAINIVNPNLLTAIDNILIDSGAGDNVASLTIIGGFIDTAMANGLHVAPTGAGGSVTRIWATGTWFGDNATNGVLLDNLGSAITSGFSCTACRIVNNGTSGVTVANASWGDIAILGGCIGDTQTGVSTVTGVNNVRLTGGLKIGQCDVFNTPIPVGVNIAGASFTWAIADVDFSGSTTPISGVANLSTCKIHDNINYNPVGASTITVGSSPFSYEAGCSPETIYISGGTISSIITNGAVVNPGAATVVLGPNEGVQVTYSALPNMQKSIH